MPRAVLLLPTTSYRAKDFVAAAESLGIDLVVASEQPPPFDMGEGYLQIDCSDPTRAAAKVARLGDEKPLDGVVAADEAGVVVAALVGTTLGLAANSEEAAATTRNKLLLRRRLAAAEIPQPRFMSVEGDPAAQSAAQEVGFPLVVKPLSRSASQGVIRVDDPEQLTSVVSRVRGILGDPVAPLILEAFVPGEEVAVEGLIRDGELTVLAIFDKPDSKTGPFFPETIMVTPSRLPQRTQDEVVRVADAALRALGLSHGPVHIELRVEEDRVSLLEIAARSIGGLCSRTLSFGLMGTSLESLILRNALGMDKPELRRESTSSGVLMIPIPASGVLVSVEGIEEARAIEGITGIDLTIAAGTRIAAPPEGDRYLGFVFARAHDAQTVEDALRRASKTIEVTVR